MTAPGDAVPPPGLRVLLADDHLVVIDKPAGLLSVPGRGADKADCAAVRVQARWPEARVVHRLDMATSGLLVFARGLAAQQALSSAFETRRVAKGYDAVVRGLPDADHGEVDQPLAADWPRRPRQMVDPAHGREARTLWRVVARDAAAGSTRMELQPLTGRTHQLRVHLAFIGHPIVGDTLYGPEAADATDPPDPAPQRLLLHATRLLLPHPATGSPVGLICPAPF